MDIIEEGKIRKQIVNVKNKAYSAVLNNDPETVMNCIREIQRLDHILYDK